MSHERRKHRRRRLLYYLDIFDGDTGEPLGKLGDVTTAGLMLLSDKAQKPGQRRDLVLRWEDERGRKASIEFSARTCWSRKDSNPEMYATGLSIQKLSPEHFARLRQLITRLAFDEVA